MEDAANHGLYEKRQAEAFAKGDHAIAKSRESLLGQAEVLQDEADRAKSGAARVGSTNPLEREQALQSALIAKEHGIDSLPPEMKAQFAALAPKEYEAAAVKAGTGSRAYSELQKSGFVDFPGTAGTAPSDIQFRADRKRKEAGEKDFDIEKESDKASEGASEKLVSALARTLLKHADRIEARVDDKMRMGKSQ